MAKLSVEQALLKAKSLTKKGELAEAMKLYTAILAAFPNNKKAQQGQATLAKANQSDAMQRPPQEAINQLANLFNQGQLAVVAQQAEVLTKRHPNNFVIWSFWGAAHQGLGQAAEAAKAFRRVTELNPQYPEGHNNLGIVLQQMGKSEESVKHFQKALSLNPDYFEAYYNMGIALKELGKLNLAIEAYQKSLSLDPTNWEAYGNMGLAFKDNSDWTEAVAAYEKALAINPNNAELFSNKGNALKDQGKLDEAIEAYNKALDLKPDYAEAYSNMGISLNEQGKLDGAIEAYNKAISIKPDYTEAYYNMGISLNEKGKLDEAIEAYKKALSLKPGYAEAYNNMGNVLKDQGKLDEAIEAYNQALDLKPDYEAARAVKLYYQAHICDWDSVAEDRKLISELGASKSLVTPFSMLSLEDAPDRHRLRSETYAKAKYPQKPLPLSAKPLKKPERLRIGYFSADFKEHPVAHLIAKVLEQHNRVEFEVFGYSLHGSSSGNMRQRLKNSFDCFTDVQDMSDRNIALRARQDEIDIAIDLNGYTQNSRTGIFAYRSAPIQISYLGYPGTMGADFMDYIVADENLIPITSQKYYSEKPIYLPHHYQAQDDSSPIANVTPSRSALGLPEKGFVFCAINASYKITSSQFSLWMRLLQNVDGSVLWLLESNRWVKANLLKEANARGVAPERLVFAQKVSHDKYLAQFRQADLYLDSFTYNAGATASNALWAGLPILTKFGKGYTARMASSLLKSLELPELITTTEQEYEDLALALANDPQRLAKLKKKLADNRLSKPLFDTKLFTRHLEDGYQKAYQNYFDGKNPQTINVPK